MKKYFLHDGNKQIGPFELSELKSNGLTRDSFVWHDGMEKWEKAKDIIELRDALKDIPPVFEAINTEPPPLFINTIAQNEYMQFRPKKSKLPIRLLIIFTIVIICIVAFVMVNNGNAGASINGLPDTQTYEEKVKTVEEIERENPNKFLIATGKYTKNLLGTKFRIDCEIINNATVATYKDIVIEVIYYTSTKTEIYREQHTIYEVLTPTSSKTILLKVIKPREAETIGWEVVNATPY